MLSSEAITIVVATDEHYMILLAALLKSIEINHKTPEKIQLFIIEDHVRKNSKTKLEASVSTDMFTVNWVKMETALPTGIKLPADRTSFPLTIYMRLFLADVVTPGTQKALFLDVDMIMLQDISKLWHTNLGNKLMAAVQDMRLLTFDNHWGGILNYKELGFAPQTKYLNTGLLLVNLPVWTQQNIPQSVIQCVRDNIKHANYPDQYGMNVILANQWLELDPRWNYFASGDVRQPYLIHFVSRKPIYKSYSNNRYYKELFVKYMSLTSWKNTQPVGEFKRYTKKLNNVWTKIKF